MPIPHEYFSKLAAGGLYVTCTYVVHETFDVNTFVLNFENENSEMYIRA